MTQPLNVVITGASRGLGLELTRQHLARGDAVFATCRGAPSAALNALACPRLTTVALDVTQEDSIQRAAQACVTPVDLLWANAGVYPGSPGTPVQEGLMGTLRAQDGLSIFATNTVGAILVVQAFLPQLRRAKGARVVAVSSGYGSVSENDGFPYWYGASKAALNMVFRSFAADPAARGILVALMSPGWSQTDMGGPGATTPVQESVAGMIRVADQMTTENNGRFWDFTGQTVPW